jgi:hypothetical protein
MVTAEVCNDRWPAAALRAEVARLLSEAAEAGAGAADEGAADTGAGANTGAARAPAVGARAAALALRALPGLRFRRRDGSALSLDSEAREAALGLGEKVLARARACARSLTI